MDILNLYKRKQYYQVVINATLCKTDLDYICLCLSLVGIGRQKTAIILLRAKTESQSDPHLKVCILLCLYEITGVSEYHLEAEYWRSVGDFDDWKFQSLMPIPLHPSNKVQDCTSIFKANGAFFHPNSYSMTVLNDKMAAKTMAGSRKPGLLLMKTIATCGSTAQVTKVLKSEEMSEIFMQIQKIVDQSGTDTESSPDIPYCLNMAQNISLVAGYYHLIKNSPKALYYCTQAINLINALRIRFGTTDLVGISDYEKETILMVASHHLQSCSGEIFVECLLSELMYPGPQNSAVEIRLNPQINSFHEISRASLLRQSFFFASCGNIYRKMAGYRSFTLSLLHNDRVEEGIVCSREDMLESTRKFVLSTALQPIDNPFLHLHYDRVIWCLLLSGGVDYCVLLLFFTIRNHFYHKAGFSPIENDPENSMFLWPKFAHGSEILQGVFEKTLRTTKSCFEEHNLFSPTALNFVDDVVFLKCFIQDPCGLHFDEPQDIDTMNSYSQAKMSENDLFYLKSSSQEIAELWISTYRNAHGEIPCDIRQVTQYFNL